MWRGEISPDEFSLHPFDQLVGGARSVESLEMGEVKLDGVFDRLSVNLKKGGSPCRGGNQSMIEGYGTFTQFPHLCVAFSCLDLGFFLRSEPSPTLSPSGRPMMYQCLLPLGTLEYPTLNLGSLSSSILNNVLEQDHRAIKRRIHASQHFRSFWSAWRTIAGYEALHMIRKGQAYGSAAGAKIGLVHRFKQWQLTRKPIILSLVKEQGLSRSLVIANSLPAIDIRTPKIKEIGL
jgi:DDE domain